MSIRLIEHKDINKLKWDQLIDSSPNSLIFDNSWYLDAVDPSWCAFVSGDYDGGMPISKNSKGGIGHAYLPFFVRELNLLGEIDGEAVSRALDAEFKRISLASSSLTVQAAWTAQESTYQLIELSPDHSDIQSNYSNNAKRSIKKAQKNLCELKRSSDTNWIVEGFKAGKGKSIKSLDSNSYDILSRLMSALSFNKALEVLEVWSGEEKLAAACFMKHKERVTYLKGHVTDQGKELGAMYFLFDNALKSYGQEHKVFDFGGSKVASVAEFYKKFGAIDSNYLFLKKDSSPIIHKAVRKIRSKIKKK